MIKINNIKTNLTIYGTTQIYSNNLFGVFCVIKNDIFGISGCKIIKHKTNLFVADDGKAYFSATEICFISFDYIELTKI